MRANIKLELSKLLPVAVLALLDNVIAKLTGNALFPDLPVSLADMSTFRDGLKKAIAEATGGSVNARKLRDKQVLEAHSLLRATADYVRSQCDGDAAKLSSSGFELSKQRGTTSPVGVPPNVVAVPTDVSGELQLRWGRTEGARMYRVERAQSDPAAGPTTWTQVALISRQRYVVSGLTSYQPAWFRIIALGIDSEGLPSDVVMGRAA